MSEKLSLKNDISIVICGHAGQGIETVSEVLLKVFKKCHYNVFSCKEYMSRVRGGLNSAQIRVSSSPQNCYSEKIDILIALCKGAIEHLKDKVSKDTLILYECECDCPQIKAYKHIETPLIKTAKEIGDTVYANMVGAGVILGIFSSQECHIKDFISQKFVNTPQYKENNILAAQKGFEIGQEILKTKDIDLDINQDNSIENKLLLNGAEAIGIGCIAAGCDFISSYPMTPGTSLFQFLTNNSDDFCIISEQAEDEISAINMAIGAWYAGSRALVSTSGGGYALMAESISLAGMTETPIVVHVAQRPGPATGLPTRTEQGDLNFVLYSGHGEFPRIIFTPGDPQEAFKLSLLAFKMADKYQIPVFILTDQYFVDSTFIVDELNIENLEIKRYITKTDESYQRYAFNNSNISPRGIPSYGKGFVCADSDEHTEDGIITENFNLRIKMVDKRMKKYNEIAQETIPPEFTGNENYKHLLVSWGSNKKNVKEALKKFNSPDIAHLHFSQVFPVDKNSKKYFEKAQNIITLENNCTGQFAHILNTYLGINITESILKYNGLPFSPEEIWLELTKRGL